MICKYLFLACLLLSACSNDRAPEDTLDFNGRLPELSSGNILREEGWYIWGGSVLKGEDGKYHMFYARWDESQEDWEPDDVKTGVFDRMRGWLKYSEIAYAISDHPDGPFKYVKTVMKGSGRPGSWNRYSAHNPHARKLDGKYYLYHTATHQVSDPSYWKSYIGGQRIGVVVADSIKDLVEGNFELPQDPLIAPDNQRTFHRVVNPSVTTGPDGAYYMMFKSYSKKSGSDGHMAHWIAKADSPTGPFNIVGNVFNDASYSAEDPYFWYDKKRNRFYAIVKNWSEDNLLAPQNGALALITSEDGIHDWQPARNKLVSLREYRDSGGKTHKLTNIERPQLLLDASGQPICLYVAALYETAENKAFYKGYPAANLHFLLSWQSQ